MQNVYVNGIVSKNIPAGIHSFIIVNVIKTHLVKYFDILNT